MTRKHIAAVGGGRQKNKIKRTQPSARRKAGLFSVRPVYFTDYTTRFKQVSRDGESDSTQKLSYQLSVHVTETSGLIEFKVFAVS